MTTFANLIAFCNLQRLLFFSFIVLNTLTVQAQEADDLFTQIQALQSRTNIQVIGLERTQNEAKVMAHGSPEQQVAWMECNEIRVFVVPTSRIPRCFIRATWNGKVKSTLSLNKATRFPNQYPLESCYR